MTLEALDNTTLDTNPVSADTNAPVSDATLPDAQQQTQSGDTAAQLEGEQSAVEGQNREVTPRNTTPRTRDYIAKLTAEKHSAIRRAEASEAATRALAKQLEDTRANRQATNDPATAVRYEVRDAVVEARVEANRANTEQALQEAHTLEVQAWNATKADARGHYPDFDKVTSNEDLAISPEMGRTIREIPEGADLFYYLGKNPDEAERIYALPVRSQATALTRLITKLPSQQAAVKSQTSGAPAPVSVVKGKAGNSVVPLADLSMEDYAKARAAGRVS